MTHPDYISVEAAQSARVEATRADFLLTVSGSSLISGAAALRQAREVADLVAHLRDVGIEEKQINIEGVRVETQSGTFSKSSAAYYSLRVESVPIERVADAVGAVANSKNTTLGQIQWRFADENPLRDELRQKCLQSALERAKGIAQILGVRLLGVYEMDEAWQGTSGGISAPRSPMVGGRARAISRVSEEELGMAVSHAEIVHMELTLKFRVSEFE